MPSSQSSGDYPFDLERNTVQALAGVLDASMVKHKRTQLTAWKSVTRLLRDIVDDGYDPYVVALAIDELVSRTTGDVIPAQLCSIPAMLAGMSMVSTPLWFAKHQYRRRFLPYEKLERFEFYKSLAFDGQRTGDKDLKEYALRRIEENFNVS